jgi:hypothetical protein
VPSCARSLSSGSVITALLEERGAALGATNVGLFEIWTKSGETIISKIYYSTDGTNPMTAERMREFASRLSRRAHQIERVNGWMLNLERGGTVIQSVPIENLTD